MKQNKLDILTEKRLLKFIEDFRRKNGQLPTLRDFELAHLNQEVIDLAEKCELIEKNYVDLTQIKGK